MLTGLHRYNFFIDLDGVLADFDGYFHQITGIWYRDLGEEEAWDTLKKIPDFWLNLPVMPDAYKLFNALSDYNPIILTSPSKHDTDRALLQKKAWVRERISHRTPVLFQRGTNKHKYACPNAVLIDDWKQNTDLWSGAGGIAIHHQSVEKTLVRIRELELSEDEVFHHVRGRRTA